MWGGRTDSTGFSSGIISFTDLLHDHPKRGKNNSNVSNVLMLIHLKLSIEINFKNKG